MPDLRGDLASVGDTIAYGALDGRSAMIRTGKIVEIVEAHRKPDYKGSTYMVDVPTKLRVEVEHSSGYRTPGKPVLIQASFKRFVKVDPR